MSSAKENKAVFRRYLEFWREGDLSTVDEIVGANYVGHVSAGDRDKAGLVERIKAFRALYPNIIFFVDDQLVVGDKVITRMKAEGIHQPNGVATALVGINISRIVDGLIVEEWAVWERLIDSYREYV